MRISCDRFVYVSDIICSFFAAASRCLCHCSKNLFMRSLSLPISAMLVSVKRSIFVSFSHKKSSCSLMSRSCALIFTSTAIKTATETASITVSIFQIMFYSSFKTHYISLRLNTPYTAISDTTAHTAAIANAPPTVFADALRSSLEI